MTSTPREIPKREQLVDYNHAVAGHAGTLCDPDGELFVKPCTQAEIDFYNDAVENHPDFASLMPIMLGTLTLNDATDVNDINEQLPVVADHMSQRMKEDVVEMAHSLHPKPDPVAEGDNITWVPNKNRKIATDTAIVLENAAFNYKRPNIMDAKLGLRLWADDAPQEKRDRFDKIAQQTTHKNLGFRVAGMRVYRGDTDPKELDHEEYKIYDKNWGRFHVNDDNVVASFRKFIFNEAAGITPEYGRAVAKAFTHDLERVREILEAEESRMYSASLLFVFEGDGEALRNAIEANNTQVDRVEAAAGVLPKTEANGKGDQVEISGRSNFRVDSGIDLDDDGELIQPADPAIPHSAIGQMVSPSIEEIVSMEDAGMDSDVSDEENVPRIYGVRLIDFAHAQWVPGQGPDENILLGVRSLIRIFGELAKDE